MADSEKFYCADAQLYCGRVGNNPDVGQGKRVVLDLCKNIEGTGRNVTTDNFFTSYDLAKELNNRRLSLVGTIRGNRKEVPKEMLPDSSKEVFSSLFGFSKDGATMVSYVPKRKKAVVLLSTQHRDNAVSTDEKSKPEIIHYYNQTKSGVDVLDKLVRTYSCKRATRRWTVSLFYNLIDMAAYNALVVWISANPEWHKGKPYGRRVFLQQLGMELVRPHATQRLTQMGGKRRRIQDSAIRAGISNISPAAAAAVEENADVAGTSKRGRCHFCPREKERKTTRFCGSCQSAVCKEHSRSVIRCKVCDDRMSVTSMSD